MKQLRERCCDDTAKLLLQSSELLRQIQHNPLLVCLVEVRLILVRNLVDMLDMVERRRAEVDFADALAKLFELQQGLVNKFQINCNQKSYFIDIFTFVSDRHRYAGFDVNSNVSACTALKLVKFTTLWLFKALKF